ncbi:hypothetical protein C8F01DRAFT_1092998 [Mycena amicta]|nr:hypothetical protein C8F01DRAFT_1092998 [Mycena amicta]
MFWDAARRSPIPPPRGIESQSFLGDDYDSPTAGVQVERVIAFPNTPFVVVIWSNYAAKCASTWHYHFAFKAAPETPMRIADIISYRPAYWNILSRTWTPLAHTTGNVLEYRTNMSLFLTPLLISSAAVQTKTLLAKSGFHVALHNPRGQIHPAEHLFPPAPTFFTPELYQWLEARRHAATPYESRRQQKRKERKRNKMAKRGEELGGSTSFKLVNSRFHILRPSFEGINLTFRVIRWYMPATLESAPTNRALPPPLPQLCSPAQCLLPPDVEYNLNNQPEPADSAQPIAHNGWGEARLSERSSTPPGRLGQTNSRRPDRDCKQEFTCLGLFDGAGTRKERRSKELFVYSPATKDFHSVDYPLDASNEKVKPEDFAAYLDSIFTFIPCHCGKGREAVSSTLLSWPDGSVVLVCHHYPASQCQMLVNINSIYETATRVGKHQARQTINTSLDMTLVRELVQNENPRAVQHLHGYLGLDGHQKSQAFFENTPKTALHWFLIEKESSDFTQETIPEEDAGSEPETGAVFLQLIPEISSFIEDDTPTRIDGLLRERFHLDELIVLNELSLGHGITKESLQTLVQKCEACEQVYLKRRFHAHQCAAVRAPKRLRIQG